MGDIEKKAPEIVLLGSEIEAAAARVAERAMNDTWQGASGFISDVFGGLVGDRVRQWRTRNLIDSLAKTKAHLEGRGVAIEKAKSLPMGELLVIFEGASKTDDADLSTMWAALLSNGMNPEKKTFIDPSFPRLLSDLSGLDARILFYIKSYSDLEKAGRQWRSELMAAAGTKYFSDDAVQAECKAKISAKTKIFAADASALRDAVTLHYSEINISYSLSNLIRLGLLTGGSGVSEDHLVSAELAYDEIRVDDSGVKSELRNLWERFDLLNEDNKHLPTLTFISRWSDNAPMPHYSLTGLAKRFLDACS